MLHQQMCKGCFTLQRLLCPCYGTVYVMKDEKLYQDIAAKMFLWMPNRIFYGVFLTDFSETMMFNLYHSLSKFSNQSINVIFFLFLKKIGLTFHANYLLEIICMKCQSLFSGKKGFKKIQIFIFWIFYPACQELNNVWNESSKNIDQNSRDG